MLDENLSWEELVLLTSSGDNFQVNSLRGQDDLDLFNSVSAILRSGKLTPDVLANFVYNRRQKFISGPYFMSAFAACENQFISLISQQALLNSQKSDTWPAVDQKVSAEIADIAEKAFGIFSTWKWEKG